ncbi:hypothetical protein KGF57_000242 [Candida theae]|uniref:Hyphally-regulated cell wall protein N-terminal domain-containing protein n=1 Tax=Candida theae TaxID=1198502 RepID=A0AAD5G128_9ASCO|nr:uncharacterized protein KGF57_000242 [Candida theae]KAI5968159.1 hypothetical protein KGF57_000242 [Candida theae]
MLRLDRGSLSLNVGDITVHSGAYWSIINNAITAFVSSLTVQPNAGLFISSTSPLIALQVTLLGLLNSITNNGVISFNAVASLTAAHYNLVGLSFENNGEMYLGASGVVSSTMRISSANWRNNGLLVFHQNQRSEGSVHLGAPLGTITNNGQICFRNEVYEQTSVIAGTGCITAQQDSTIYISNAALSVSSGQTFYLADGASSMIVEALSTPQTFNVRNFGQVNGVSNKIGLTIPLFSVLGNPWTYNQRSGILTLKGAGILQQYFNIGPGYDATKFQLVTDSGSGIPSTVLGSIQYNGPVPRAVLTRRCNLCKPLPEIPGAQPTEYTTTITSQNNGHTSTETGIVIISTDAHGAWYTSTTILTAEITENTQRLTTWTTTNTDGSVDTDKGIVVEIDDLVTTFATFPDVEAYTTTWTSTDTDGSVVTESGIVLQNEDSFTTVTTFPQNVEGLEASEYITTWTTTESDGTVETESGLVLQIDDLVTTFATFPDVEAYTTTWTSTDTDGSVVTESGIVLQNEDSLTTFSTFPESIAGPEASQYPTTWTATEPDGSVETESGIVLHHGDSLSTITTFGVAAEVTYSGRWSNSSVAYIGDDSETTNSPEIFQTSPGATSGAANGGANSGTAGGTDAGADLESTNSARNSISPQSLGAGISSHVPGDFTGHVATVTFDTEERTAAFTASAAGTSGARITDAMVSSTKSNSYSNAGGLNSLDVTIDTTEAFPTPVPSKEGSSSVGAASGTVLSSLQASADSGAVSRASLVVTYEGLGAVMGMSSVTSVLLLLISIIL